MKTLEGLIPLLFLGALVWFGIGKFLEFTTQRTGERAAIAAEQEGRARQANILRQSLANIHSQEAEQESARQAERDASLPKVKVKLRDGIDLDGGRVEQIEILTQSQYEHWVKTGKPMKFGRPALRQ